MIPVAKIIVIAFGMFFIAAGLFMLFAPQKARQTVRKAGSTNFINYAELTLRMIPAVALIMYADYSKYPTIFKTFGWFMLVTSIILCLVPPRLHHQLSNRFADALKPLYFQLISPLSILMGVAIIYSVY